MSSQTINNFCPLFKLIENLTRIMAQWRLPELTAFAFSLEGGSVGRVFCC